MSKFTKDDPAQNTGTLTRLAYSLYTITVNDLNEQSLDILLKQKVTPNQKALENLCVTLDVSAISDLTNIDFKSLRRVCEKYSLHLIGLNGVVTEEQTDFLREHKIPIVNSNRFAKVREENLNPKLIVKTLEVKIPVEVQVPREVQVPVEAGSEPMKVITRTLRSGETVGALNNSVAVFGSVRMGARIIASHNIFIFGDLLQGEVYAGNPKAQEDPGYTSAIIYVSGHFDPSIVAIAGNYETAEDMENNPLIGPLKSEQNNVIVSLEGSTLVYTREQNFNLKK